jgi:hypothetical protein
MKRRMNAALRRTTGYELRKPKSALTPEELAAQQRRQRRRLRAGDRLLEAPTFVLCSVRSGSTLLRVLLDSHSRICAPHELHLRDISVSLRTDYSERSLSEIGLGAERLEYLLWDRMLHRELAESGKDLLVNKTPSDVFIVERIRECWPDARFIFLLRHPVSITRSRQASRPQDSEARNLKMVRRYCNAIEAARHTYDGLTVRYEDITTDPERETRRLCEFLGVAWEPGMVDYGQFDHGRLRPGLGDWSEQIKSGRVQPPKPLPSADEVPDALRELTAAWGYTHERAAQP